MQVIHCPEEETSINMPPLCINIQSFKFLNTLNTLKSSKNFNNIEEETSINMPPLCINIQCLRINTFETLFSNFHNKILYQNIITSINMPPLCINIQRFKMNSSKHYFQNFIIKYYNKHKHAPTLHQHSKF